MTAKTPLEALQFALEKYPQRVEIVPLAELVIESARQNEKRPAFVKIALPDHVVKELRGGGSDHDMVLVVSVPRDVLQRSESSIVLPGEVR